MASKPSTDADVKLSAADTSRVVEMAWDDSTPFEAIKTQFSLGEDAAIALMRGELKPSSYRLWRQRVQGRKSKHAALQRLVQGQLLA